MIINQPFSKKKIHFISDTHFGHSNIIDYCNRPFENREVMDERMKRNWNKKVGKNDIVIHGGDVSFHDEDTTNTLLHQLNGTKYLVVGNHDKNLISSKKLRGHFKEVVDKLEIIVNDDELDTGHAYIVISHCPFLAWDNAYYGSWHLFGHVHNSMEHPDPNAHNLSVEVNNYTPRSYQEIKTIITRKNMNSE